MATTIVLHSSLQFNIIFMLLSGSLIANVQLRLYHVYLLPPGLGLDLGVIVEDLLAGAKVGDVAPVDHKVAVVVM